MKFKDLAKLKSLAIIFLLFFSYVHPEKVWVTGDYTVAGTVKGDLVVTNGNVDITVGDLIVTGDLKVTGGSVNLANGNLYVDGDLIVTNDAAGMKSLPSADSLEESKLTTIFSGDAFVQVYGDVEVTGAIITNSLNGRAFVYAGDYGYYHSDGESPSNVGSLKAGRITTKGHCDAFVAADHHITIIGALVIRSDKGDGSFGSNGYPGIYGNVYAGSVSIISGSFFAVVTVSGGHLTVNGPIFTDAGCSAYVYAEGNLFAGLIHTKSRGECDFEYNDCACNYGKQKSIRGVFGLRAAKKDCPNNPQNYGDAYVEAEHIDVLGDIRTYARYGDAYVLARWNNVRHGDIIANNIYTWAFYSAYVEADRHIEVKGDIFTRGNDEAYVLAGTFLDDDLPFWQGHIKAQNIMTRSIGDSNEDAYVKAKDGIFVTAEIITENENGDAYVYSVDGVVKAGNIYTASGPGYDYYVKNDGSLGIDVTHSIRTNLQGDSIKAFRNGCTGKSYVHASDSFIRAEKIFTKGFCDSRVEASDEIDVKGPIKTKSYGYEANVLAGNDINAGAIVTDGGQDCSVESAAGSIIVIEDIHTKSDQGDTNVHALTGDIKARSIRTEGSSDDSIKSAAGTGRFTWLPTPPDAAIIIKDSDFDLDHDYEWNWALSLDGTCTLNGKGHHLNFGPMGRIYVTAGSTLFLKNIKMRNIGGQAIRCDDDVAKIHLDNVTWTLTSDYELKKGYFHIDGDFNIKGAGKSFIYQSTEQSTIHSNAKWTFDYGTTLSYDAASNDRVLMESGSARICFNQSLLNANKDIQLTKGALRFDNKVTFSAVPSRSITLGSGSAPNNVGLEFGKGSKLVYIGNLVNSNV